VGPTKRQTVSPGHFWDLDTIGKARIPLRPNQHHHLEGRAEMPGHLPHHRRADFSIT
jgi:hypothetical protein